LGLGRVVEGSTRTHPTESTEEEKILKSKEVTESPRPCVWLAGRTEKEEKLVRCVRKTSGYVKGESLKLGGKKKKRVN